MEIFSGSGLTENIPTHSLRDKDYKDDKIDICSILTTTGLCESRGDARRTIEQGGISVNGTKINDSRKTYTKEEINSQEFVVKRGKKTFRKVVNN